MTSVVSEFANACSSIYNIAQRNACVTLEGALKTPGLTLAADMGVMGATLGLGVYGTYRVIRAKSVGEVLKFGALSAIGFAAAFREIRRNMTDYTDLAHNLCTGSSGNRFSGWERCAQYALGTFKDHAHKLSYMGYFSCTPRY